MPEEEQCGTASVVANLVETHIRPTTLKLNDPDNPGSAVEVLILPTELTVTSTKLFLDEYRSAPVRREGTARLGDLASFIAHAQRFADADSALFADANPRSAALVSVLDYHRAGAKSDPRFGKHRGVYSFPLSDEWTAWTSKNAAAMSQADFAEWVENHITEVADPSAPGDTAKALAHSLGCTFASPSKLLELSRGLSIRIGAKIQNAQNLATGEVQMQFVAQHQDESGAPLKVPGAFLCALPVFRNGAPYQVPVRLRYRLREGTVLWFYELYRADRVFDHAFREACKQAQEATGLPLFFGFPE